MQKDSFSSQHMLHMQSVQNLFSKELTNSLKFFSPKHSFHEILNYAVCPPGKLFRPMLAWGVACDLAGKSLTPQELTTERRDILTFALALEFHHAYSLVHDDLPAMDNDQYRRGKLATHAQYGEWQAILAGDGLLNLSYYCLSKIKSHNLQTLLALMGHALGPKGLVFGQVMDLSKDRTKSVNTILQIHELKTARLFQVALTGSFLLMTKTPQNVWSTEWRPYWKLGRSLGIVFQLLDDITELFVEGASTHEGEVNPWPYHYHFLCKTIEKEITTLVKISKTFNMRHLDTIWRPYFSNFVREIENNQEQLFCALTNKKSSNMQKNDLQILMGVLQGLNFK